MKSNGLHKLNRFDLNQYVWINSFILINQVDFDTRFYLSDYEVSQSKFSVQPTPFPSKKPDDVIITHYYAMATFLRCETDLYLYNYY